ncbi:hd superfamily [Stylonychia lemnae]|uniref:Hd superfamily n=1 Tax=Stylonychia lemnae TaxID=5949 RepID=A0A078A913_STYLE|nr:hd superfamily [Stylonychia lemnae]|eukprot:CDW77293.1 hd superfamily [Stylonychia lemnae]
MIKFFKRTMVLMNQTNMQSLLYFVKDSTKHFDSSHNHEHAELVYSNTMKIMDSLYKSRDEYDEELITYASLLHDVRDHKYPESITEEEMHKFLIDQVGEDKTKQVLQIIENVSWSKEDKLRKSQGLNFNPDFPQELQTYLTALRDADRLEAIGQIGIERCVQFNISHGYKYPEDVIQHCHDKLLRIYTEKFIETEMGRKLAEPLHQEIVDFVKMCESGNVPDASVYLKN